jgi:hypothetical protein
MTVRIRSLFLKEVEKVIGKLTRNYYNSKA